MWDGVMSKCAQIVCSESPQIENGEYVCESDEYNSSCQAKCKNGYRLVGGATVTCGSLGTYQLADGIEQPQCQLIKCPTLATPLNGAISLGKGSGETVNSTAQIQCDDGYAVFTKDGAFLSQIKCGASGEWENKAERVGKT